MLKRLICILLVMFYTSASLSHCSVTAAAAFAGEQYHRLSVIEDREYMGGIVERNGIFTYTVTSGKRRKDKVTARILIPEGARLVGLWHTHGSPHHSRKFFSAVDTQLVRLMGVPFFLTDPAGRLRVFEPGAKVLTRQQSRALGLGTSKGNARGELARVVASPNCSPKEVPVLI